MTATWPTLPASVPDLSGLSVEQASFLEDAMMQAAIQYGHKADSYRNEGDASLAAEAFAHRERALLWSGYAKYRELRAIRERCIAIRVIQAFAQAAAAEPIQEAAE